VIYSVTTPVGLDVPIKEVQHRIYDGIRSLWSLTEDQVRAFPRAYRQDGRIMLFTSYYLDADGFLDDAYVVQYFFLEQEPRSFSRDIFSTPVDIYFFVNLDTAKGTTKRFDEEVKQDIFNIVRSSAGDFQSFGEVDLEGYNDKMNMQPYHSFKVTTNLTYRYDKTF
jgi:hypothetical protein